MPSDIHCVSKFAVCADTQSATARGCHGWGCRFARRLCQVLAALNVRSPAGRLDRFMTLTGRSSRAASDMSASTRLMRAVQLGAPAHDPSSAISKLPVPARLSVGLSTGPAKPMMRAATAMSRSSKSHHGVRSDWLSSSCRPSKSATPGKRRLTGAGGTARSKSHKIGKMIRPSKSNGTVKPRGPSVHIYCASSDW